MHCNQNTLRRWTASARSGSRCVVGHASSPRPQNPHLSRSVANIAFNETIASQVQAKSASQPPGLDFTNINRHTFSAALPIICEAIQDATFIAIDTEFTGLMPDGMFEEVLDTYDARYKRWVAASENFIICQFGLSAFKWRSASGTPGGGHWEARTFNAYVFPMPEDGLGWDKRFACQASSLAYLAAQGFDFNKFIRDGVGYMPLRLRKNRLRAVMADADKQAVAPRASDPVQEGFAEELRARVQAWLLGSEPQLRLPLPPSKRLRTLLKAVIQGEFQLPSSGFDPFKLEMMLPRASKQGADAGSARGSGDEEGGSSGSSSGEEGDKGSEDGLGTEWEVGEGEGGEAEALEQGAMDKGYVLLQRLDGWQLEPIVSTNMQLTVRQRAELMAEKIGFSQVFEAICEARRPVVVHNGCFDLAFMLAQFSGSLPPTWPEYKALLRQTFSGGLYDTKYLAQELAQSRELPLGHTSLSNLHRTLMDEQWFRANVRGLVLAGRPGGVPEVRNAPGHEGYAGVTDKAHEAGFDAFMTGAVFVRLLRIAEGKAAAAAAVLALNGGQVPAGSSSPGAGDNSEDGNGGGSVSVSGGNSATNAAGVLPAEVEALLQPVLPYRGRLHIVRSDLPFMDVYGKDPPPNRPCTLHVAGFMPTTRPHFLVNFFQEAGLGPVIVGMQYGQDRAAVGALVQLPSVDHVPRALQLVRKRWPAWTVQTFKSYYESPQQQRQDASTATARALPRYISTGPGTAAATASSRTQPEGQQAEGAALRATDERRPRDGAIAAGTERQRLKAITGEVAAKALPLNDLGPASGATTAGTAAGDSAQQSDDRGPSSTTEGRTDQVAAVGPRGAMSRGGGAEKGAGTASGGAAPSGPAIDTGAATAQGHDGTEAMKRVRESDEEAARVVAEQRRLAAERLQAAELTNASSMKKPGGGSGGMMLQRPSRQGSR